MDVSIRRLGPGDEAILEFLATHDADFDLEGRGEPLLPLDAAKARRYLANPAVLHWLAVEDDQITGFLYCIHLPLRSGEGQELLLYEIGVRSEWRRRGVGRALLDRMETWMRSNGVSEVWALADNEVAVQFYRGCGFAAEQPQPVYMTRELGLPSSDSQKPGKTLVSG
jgi:GNAT superfamily N-acetyltransferase